MITLSLSLLLAILVVVAPSSAPAKALSGSQFDPARLISDANFYNGSAMTEDQIQAFLESKVPSCANGNCLTVYRVDTYTRVSNAYCSQYTGAAGERASTVIFKVQQACGISAKVILVTLQKEQGLVTSTAPTTGKLERAMGYACPDTGQGCDPTYAGLYNQIYRAAWQFKRYADPGFTRYPVGKPSAIAFHPNAACGAATVTIANKATAALYYYTPYQPNSAALTNLYGTGDSCSSYGNRNFWRYYYDWFGTPTGPSGSPDGELSSVSSGYGNVSISGWAADVSDPSAAVSVAVQIDAAWYGVVANESRPDIGAAYPAYGPNHGFSGTFNVSEGSHTMCVYLKNVGEGGDVSLGCRNFVTPNGSPVGEITAVSVGPNVVVVNGWIVDPDAPTTPVVLDVQLGSQWLAVTADASSPGTGAVFPGAGDQHGIAMSASVDAGTYPLCIYARNIGTGSAISLGCRTVTVPGVAKPNVPPVGALTAVSTSPGTVAISGWAVDADAPTSALMIDVQLDGWKALTANQSTSAAEAAVPGAGPSHGFSGSWSVPAGTHTMCVYVKGAGAGGDASLGCRTVTVPAASAGSIPVGGLFAVTGSAGAVSISGWAVDSDSPTSALMIDVQFDGWKALTANLSTAEADAVVSGAGPNHGFSGSWPASPGTHLMCIYVKGAGAGGDASLGCHYVTVTAGTGAKPVGALQSVTGSGGAISVSGWVVDPDAPMAPVTVDFQASGWRVLTAKAANSASAAAVPGSGSNHGFTGSWSAPAGNHYVCAYARGIGPGGDTALGCSWVSVVN